MKKILIAFMFGLMAIAAHAEATFDQVQTLIEQHNYSAAEKGLEVIIQNHPKSAKAFYAMAQAQAGLGNLEKAQKALDIATGLNPALDFAPSSAVSSLKQAITPQTKKIEVIEESHFWVTFAYFALFCGFIVACYFLYSVYARKRDEDEAEILAKQKEHEEAMEQVRARMAAERTADAKKSSESSGYTSTYTPRPAYRGTTQTVTSPTPAPSTTVINNTTSNSNNDLLTGVLIGNMLSGSHHDTTRVVEREVVREVPAPSRSSSWDDTPSTPSRSSSWDDDSSSSKSSSSWSSSSDSSSSSSWDSGSSSSDSSSSSSWD